MMIRIAVLLTIAVFAVACGKKESKPAEKPAAEKKAETDKPAEGDKKAVDAPAEVSVSAAGSKYDPPVEIAQIPKGAWYCDMGTVHFARLEEGNGKCDLCKMKLHQKK